MEITTQEKYDVRGKNSDECDSYNFLDGTWTDQIAEQDNEWPYSRPYYSRNNK